MNNIDNKCEFQSLNLLLFAAGPKVTKKPAPATYSPSVCSNMNYIHPAGRKRSYSSHRQVVPANNWSSYESLHIWQTLIGSVWRWRTQAYEISLFCSSRHKARKTRGVTGRYMHRAISEALFLSVTSVKTKIRFGFSQVGSAGTVHVYPVLHRVLLPVAGFLHTFAPVGKSMSGKHFSAPKMQLEEVLCTARGLLGAKRPLLELVSVQRCDSQASRQPARGILG